MGHAAGMVSTLWHSVGASHGPCNASSTQPWPHTSPQHLPQPGLVLWEKPTPRWVRGRDSSSPTAPCGGAGMR